MDPDSITTHGNGHGRVAGYLPAPEVPQYAQYGQYAPEEPRVELRDYMRIVMKRRRIIVLTFLGVVCSAAVYVMSAPRVYRATAKVQVLQPQVPASVLLMGDAGGKTPEISMKTQAKIVQSSIIAEKAEEMLKGTHKGDIPASQMGAGLSVAIEDPDVLAISVEHTDPTRAQLVANTIQTCYVNHTRDAAQMEVASAESYLSDQLPRLERELTKSEDQIKEFKKTHNIQLDAVADIQLKAAYDYISQAEQARAELQATQAELTNLRSQLALEKPFRAGKRIVNDPVAEGMRTEIATTQVELAREHARYEDTHPRVQALKARLEELQSQYKERYGKSGSSFQMEDVQEPNPVYEEMRYRVRDLEGRIASLKSRADALSALGAQKGAQTPNAPEAYVELARYEHAREVAEKAYMSLLEQQQQVQLTKARQLGAARVVDWANRPTTPIRPRTQQTILLAVIVGLMAGISLALLQEYADTSVHDPDELMLRTGITSVGFIPAARDPGINVKIAARSPKSPIAEGFRSIRSNLKFSHLDSPLRTLMITSAGAGEGKSFTAANMAIVFAQTGASVILVDADLRRPTVHRTWNIEHTPGLTNVLAGEAALDDVIRKTDIDNLSIIPSGSVPPNPSELLDSQRMASLIELLKERAAVIIFDTPPALVVTDAVVLSARVDTSIIVVEQGKASARALAEIRRMIEQARGHVAGAVLNKVRASAGDYYYYYYYRYYHYYGDGDKKRMGSGGQGRMLPDAAEDPVLPLPGDKV